MYICVSEEKLQLLIRYGNPDPSPSYCTEHCQIHHPIVIPCTMHLCKVLASPLPRPTEGWLKYDNGGLIPRNLYGLLYMELLYGFTDYDTPVHGMNEDENKKSFRTQKLKLNGKRLISVQTAEFSNTQLRL